jgi:hypothetical protein
VKQLDRSVHSVDYGASIAGVVAQEAAHRGCCAEESALSMLGRSRLVDRILVGEKPKLKERTDDDALRPPVAHGRRKPAADHVLRGGFPPRRARSMTYVTVRCMNAPETPRNASEVVEACTNWGAAPRACDVEAEPSVDSSNLDSTID